MRFVILPTVLAAGLLTSVSATAAPPDGDKAASPPVRYAERTQIDFEALKVDGELVRPAVQWVPGRKGPTFPSLIRLRENFDDQMRASVDLVK